MLNPSFIWHLCAHLHRNTDRQQAQPSRALDLPWSPMSSQTHLALFFQNRFSTLQPCFGQVGQVLWTTCSSQTQKLKKLVWIVCRRAFGASGPCVGSPEWNSHHRAVPCCSWQGSKLPAWEQNTFYRNQSTCWEHLRTAVLWCCHVLWVTKIHFWGAEWCSQDTDTLYYPVMTEVPPLGSQLGGDLFWVPGPSAIPVALQSKIPEVLPSAAPSWAVPQLTNTSCKATWSRWPPWKYKTQLKR